MQLGHSRAPSGAAVGSGTFEELDLIEPLERALRGAGYSHPTPIQVKAIPPALEGRDVLGCAQTGTGKTAAFVLPILQYLHASAPRAAGRRIRALVLAPTRELAAQIGESITKYGRHLKARSLVIFGGVGQQRQVDELRRGVDIVVACPGRLWDLMEQGHVDLSHVDVLVLDECDRMLDQGFWPTIKRIVAKVPKDRQTMFFSATMPKELEPLAAQLLHDPVRVSVTPVASTPDRIDQHVWFVEQPEKRHVLEHVLRTQDDITRAVVFTKTKHGANRVSKHLTDAGIRAEAIHGNKSQNARERALSGFRSGELRVLVATDLAARGLDIQGVSHVINYDLPVDPESYVHRIGRTARAGRTGAALSLCSREERPTLTRIERLISRPIAVAGGDVPKATRAVEAREPRSHGARPDRAVDVREMSAEAPHKARDREPRQGERHTREPSQRGEAPRAQREQAIRNVQHSHAQREHVKRERTHAQGEHAQRQRAHGQSEREHVSRERTHVQGEREHAQRERTHGQREREHVSRERTHVQREREHVSRERTQGRELSPRPEAQREHEHRQQREQAPRAQAPREQARREPASQSSPRNGDDRDQRARKRA